MRNIIAYRYAKALFDLSTNNKSLNLVYKNIVLLNEVLKNNNDLNKVINSPSINGNKKNNILQNIFKYKNEYLIFDLLKLMISNKRYHYIYSMTKEFIYLYYKYMNIVVFTITSPIKLKKNDFNYINEILKKITKNKNTKLLNIINNKLIGGIIIDFNSVRYDFSILNQLNIIKNKIIS